MALLEKDLLALHWIGYSTNHCITNLLPDSSVVNRLNALIFIDGYYLERIVFN